MNFEISKSPNKFGQNLQKERKKTMDAVWDFVATKWSFIATNWIWIIMNMIIDPLALYFTIVFLADLNFIFTKVEEGTCKVVVRGGKVIRYLVQYAGHRINRATGKVMKDEEPLNLFQKMWRRLFGGIRVIGIPFIDKLLEFELTYIRKNEETPSPRKYKYVTLTPQDYTMPPKIVRPGKGERFTVAMKYALFIQVKNVFKALIEARPNFLYVTDDLVDAALRFWAAKKDFDQIMTVSEKRKPLEASLLKQVGAEILKNFGVEVINIAIKNVDPERNDIIEAIEKKFEATKDLEAALIKKNQIEALGEAHAAATKKVIEATAGKTADEVAATAMLLQAQKGESDDSLIQTRKAAIGAKPIVEALGRALRGGG